MKIIDFLKKHYFVSVVISTILSLFALYSHLIEILFFLSFGGIFFIVLNSLLLPFLFLLSPGLLLVYFIWPYLVNLLSYNTDLVISDNILFTVNFVTIFGINVIYFKLVALIIHRFHISPQNFLFLVLSLIAIGSSILMVIAAPFLAIVFGVVIVAATILNRYTIQKK